VDALLLLWSNRGGLSLGDRSGGRETNRFRSPDDGPLGTLLFVVVGLVAPSNDRSRAPETDYKFVTRSDGVEGHVIGRCDVQTTVLSRKKKYWKVRMSPGEDQS
jgi:hypothetical protein